MRAMGVPLPTKSATDRMTLGAGALSDWLNSKDGLNQGWVAITNLTTRATKPPRATRAVRQPALAVKKDRANSHIAVIRPDQASTVASIGNLLMGRLVRRT